MEFDLYEKVVCRNPAAAVFRRIQGGLRVDTVKAAVALPEDVEE